MMINNKLASDLHFYDETGLGEEECDKTKLNIKGLSIQFQNWRLWTLVLE